MWYYIHITVKSARIALWPAIIANAALVGILDSQSLVNSILLAIGLSCVASFGFIINDIVDVVIDRTNNSRRLENTTPSGLKFLNWSALVFLITACCFAMFAGSRAFIFITAIAIALIYYTYYAKKQLFVATALAAVLSSSPLWLPDGVFLLVANPLHLSLSVFAILLLCGREMIFDSHDVKGDQCGGRRTLATVFGPNVAARIGFVLCCSGALLLSFVVLFANSSQHGFLLITTSLAVMTALTSLLLKPAYLLAYGDVNETHFQSFIFKSRLAMLCLPLILLLL